MDSGVRMMTQSRHLSSPLSALHLPMLVPGWLSSSQVQDPRRKGAFPQQWLQKTQGGHWIGSHTWQLAPQRESGCSSDFWQGQVPVAPAGWGQVGGGFITHLRLRGRSGGQADVGLSLLPPQQRLLPGKRSGKVAVGSLSREVVKRVGAVCRRTATWSQDFNTIHLLAVGPRSAVEPVSLPLCVVSGRLVPGQAVPMLS